jgi:tight adherence protein C
MTLLIAITLFVVVTGIIFAFGYRHYVKPARFLDQLSARTADPLVPRAAPKSRPTFSVAKFLQPVGNLLPVSPQDATLLRSELSAAGIRSESAVAVFYGVKITLAAGLILVALIARGGVENPLIRMLLPVFGGVLGYMLPGFGLGKIIKRRQEQIRLALPDVLDLLVICTEAGCGLDQALVNVSRDLKEVHRAVSEELSLATMEIMAGKSRAEALRNLARRTDEEELKKLVAILIQTDKFGTSVGDALRTQSEFLRMRRRQEAEERAGKVGVKLVFPIFFFCMPSLLVVTAGPGMIQLFHNLFPAMAGQH